MQPLAFWTHESGHRTCARHGRGLAGFGGRRLVTHLSFARGDVQQNSWPNTTSRDRSIGLRPGKCFASSTMRWACLRACRSDPQMPQASDLTSTMPAPGLGSGISSTTISPFLKMAARTNVPPGDFFHLRALSVLIESETESQDFVLTRFLHANQIDFTRATFTWIDYQSARRYRPRHRPGRRSGVRRIGSPGTAKSCERRTRSRWAV